MRHRRLAQRGRDGRDAEGYTDSSVNVAVVSRTRRIRVECMGWISQPGPSTGLVGAPSPGKTGFFGEIPGSKPKGHGPTWSGGLGRTWINSPDGKKRKYCPKRGRGVFHRTDRRRKSGENGAVRFTVFFRRASVAAGRVESLPT